MPEVRLSGRVFAEALDRVISDAEFRDALRARPADILPEIGIEIEDSERAELVAQRLASSAERISSRLAVDLPNGPLPLPSSAVLDAIEPATDVAVDVVVVILADHPTEEAIMEIQRANAIKMREVLSRLEDE